MDTKTCDELLQGLVEALSLRGLKVELHGLESGGRSIELHLELPDGTISDFYYTSKSTNDAAIVRAACITILEQEGREVWMN